jgi:hypothetical protein
MTLATSGPGSLTPSRFSDPTEWYLRTLRPTSGAVSESWPQTLPRSGTASAGHCSELPTWEPLTGESDCSSLLPTPHANMTTGPGTSGRDGGLKGGSSGDPMLPNVVHKLTLLPTPTARDWKSSASNLHGTNARPLNEIVKLLVPDGLGWQGWQQYEPAIRRWEAVLDREAPFPAVLGPEGGVKVAPTFGEWLMGLPEGLIASVPDLTINQQLKLVGNGVVPQQAEAAIRFLLEHNGKQEMMTTQDTSSFFTTHQSRDVPRDQWGRYKLPGPDGTEQSWTRATTFAATLAEQYGLSIWHQRQVVWGMSRRPDLLTMASTISGPEDKKALGEIVDEAHIAAGTKAKANRGTAIHLAIAAAERGAWEQVPEELRPHVAGYLEAMRAGGLVILPEYIERTVIVRQYGVAGTFDNLVRCPDGKLRVSDKKTGRMDYSDTEFSVQMALYANADAIFNYDTGRYEPMPEVEKDYAILAVIDPATGKTELQRINIEWGWVWARTCAEVRDIRATKHVITPYIAPEKAMPRRIDGTVVPLPGAVGHAKTPMVQPQATVVEYVNSDGQRTRVDSSAMTVAQASSWLNGPAPALPFIEQPGTVNHVVPADTQAFWLDDRHTDDEEPATLNGVPIEQYGAASKQWGCFSGQPCEFTGDEGLHSDGTVCLYGNARPGPIPPLDVNRNPGHIPPEANPDSGEPRQPDGEIVDPDDLVAQIDGLKGGKAAVQNVARRLMAKVGVKEGDPGAIKLQQYKIKIARSCVDLAYAKGVSIPGPKDGDPEFGVPAGPAPTDSASGAPAAATKAKGERSATEVKAPDPDREAKIRTAVESIMMQTTIQGLQERHAYYSGTSLGWTEEMQTAARTRAAAIDAEQGESELSPMEMIQGATTRETLSKAWDKVTDGGKNMAGWTEALNAAAMAKETELSGGTQ